MRGERERGWREEGRKKEKERNEHANEKEGEKVRRKGGRLERKWHFSEVTKG